MGSEETSLRRKLPAISLLALSALFTLVNAFKPLTIDDTASYDLAAQIARSPLDPYGFAMLWYRTPMPANHVVLPPVNAYWWALGIHLFGDDPFAWKLWRFPFALLFVFGLSGLFRRFAKGIEGPLVWMTVLSPTFLPAFNMMLDVPALGLGLAGLNMFFASCDDRSWKRAALAGLLLGLSMQTKYTGFLLLGAAGLYAILYRRIRIGLATASVAAILFAGWETFVAVRYGESHFLFPLLNGHPFPKASWTEFIRPLTVYWGGLAPGLVLLGCVALGMQIRVVAMLVPVLALPYLVVGWLPDSGMEWVRRFHLAAEHQSLNRRLLGLIGALVVAVTMGLALVRVRTYVTRREGEEPGEGLRGDAFLFLWLVLEVVGTFALSPFPAARRVMGVTLAATAWLGRHAALRYKISGRKGIAYAVAAIQAALGMGFAAVDWMEARAEKAGVVRAMGVIRSLDESSTVWYGGRFGFQFYARRLGMRPAIPYYEPPAGGDPLPGPSTLRAGDWLVVADPRIHRQDIVVDSTPGGPLNREWTIRLDDPVPLRTAPCYYGGYTPIEHLEGPRFSVEIFRVKRDFIPN